MSFSFAGFEQLPFGQWEGRSVFERERHVDHHHPIYDHHYPIYSHLPSLDGSDCSMRPLFPQPEQPWSSLMLPPLPTPAGSPHLPAPVTPYDYRSEHDYTSPSYGGASSNDTSSSWSDRHNSPYSSPCPSTVGLPSELLYLESPFPDFGGVSTSSKDAVADKTSCVSMQQVQLQADLATEQYEFNDGFYGSSAEEGYQTCDVASDDRNSFSASNPISPAPASPTTASPVPPESPTTRRPSDRLTRPVTSPGMTRVSKNTTRRKSSSSSKSSSKSNPLIDTSASNKAFPCILKTYGCDSSFGNKNEWKRHVLTQHLRLGFWRCDQCEERENKINDFNRKDLYIQHMRRMHMPKNSKSTEKTKNAGPQSLKKEPEDEQFATSAARCYHHTRDLPTESCCNFCDDRFTSWEDRMEHVGHHLESAKKAFNASTDPEEWKEDEVLHEYLVREEIVEQRPNGRWVLQDTQ